MAVTTLQRASALQIRHEAWVEMLIVGELQIGSFCRHADFLHEGLPVKGEPRTGPAADGLGECCRKPGVCVLRESTDRRYVAVGELVRRFRMTLDAHSVGTDDEKRLRLTVFTMTRGTSRRGPE